MYEKDSEDIDSKTFSVQFLNILLQEAFECENSIRLATNESVLETAPIITLLSETIPYHDAITRGALPYGLVWQMQQAENNTYLSISYRGMFVTALKNASKAVIVEL